MPPKQYGPSARGRRNYQSRMTWIGICLNRSLRILRAISNPAHQAVLSVSLFSESLDNGHQYRHGTLQPHCTQLPPPSLSAGEANLPQYHHYSSYGKVALPPTSSSPPSDTAARCLLFVAPARGRPCALVKPDKRVVGSSSSHRVITRTSVKS